MKKISLRSFSLNADLGGVFATSPIPRRSSSEIRPGVCVILSPVWYPAGCCRFLVEEGGGGAPPCPGLFATLLKLFEGVRCRGGLGRKDPLPVVRRSRARAHARVEVVFLWVWGRSPGICVLLSLAVRLAKPTNRRKYTNKCTPSSAPLHHSYAREAAIIPTLPSSKCQYPVCTDRQKIVRNLCPQLALL